MTVATVQVRFTLQLIADVLIGTAAEHGELPRQPYTTNSFTGIDIAKYISRWVRYTDADDGQILLALIYMDRACQTSGVVISRRTVHRLLLAALVLAAKWTNDHLHSMQYYAKVGGVGLDDMVALEMSLLQDIGWNMFVSNEHFEKYICAFVSDDWD
eukprot:Hpha_TRINITY_DN16542_c9_g1::TRINITY_DN16542_c9_g1_i2::g.135926::m.135926